MSKLEEILEKVYLAGYRDSTRRASGSSAEAHVAALKVKRLVLESLGMEWHHNSKTWCAGANTRLEDVAKKVTEL